VVNFLEAQAQRADEGASSRDAAVAHYNLGNFLRGWNDRLALTTYRAAARRDPDYLLRPYYCRELGGILFMNGRHRLAVVAYARALELGEGDMCSALRADALLFSGQLADAQGRFEALVSNDRRADPEWRLKATATRWIREALRIDTVPRRDPRAASELLADRSEGEESADSKARVIAALALDPLCGRGWFELGALELLTEDRPKAFRAFLTAALLLEGNVEAWLKALGLGASGETDVVTVGHIIQVATRRVGNELMDALAELADRHPDRLPTSRLLELAEALRSKHPPASEVWLLGPGREFHVIPLRPDTADEEE
jgi:tetratricopeptide (TPR) repeat protein